MAQKMQDARRIAGEGHTRMGMYCPGSQHRGHDQLPRVLYMRTSKNAVNAKFAEFPFHALR
jgi:hypothetical protein